MLDLGGTSKAIKYYCHILWWVFFFIYKCLKKYKDCVAALHCDFSISWNRFYESEEPVMAEGSKPVRSALENCVRWRTTSLAKSSSYCALGMTSGGWCTPNCALDCLQKSSQAERMPGHRVSVQWPWRAVAQCSGASLVPFHFSVRTQPGKSPKPLWKIWPYKTPPQAFIIQNHCSSHPRVKLALKHTNFIQTWPSKIFMHVSHFQLTVFKGAVCISSLMHAEKLWAHCFI